MELYIMFSLSCLVVVTSAWSVPFYPVHAAQRLPHRFIRHVRHVRPLSPKPIVVAPVPDSEEQWQRPKRDHEFERDHEFDRDHDRDRSRGVTGPIHTFVKTDKNANYKWGVRHHVGNKFAS